MEDAKIVPEYEGEELRANSTSPMTVSQVVPDLTVCRPWSSPLAQPAHAQGLTKVGGSHGGLSLLDPGFLILCVPADLLQAEKVNELLFPGAQWFLQAFKPGHQRLLPCFHVISIGMVYFFKICRQVCEGVHLILGEG